MNELKLSRRLETVADYIPKEAILADIGSDHAYLPCYAYLQGKIKGAVAGEITEGPLQSARQQVSKLDLNAVIEVRKGDGLEVIEPNEVDCITIAGMGGSLIAKILEEGKEKLSGVKRLILQPNVGAIRIREWLYENGWEIIAEKILEEDGKIYEIIAAEKGNPASPYDSIESGLLLGPFLSREKNETFIKKWSEEARHWKKILAQLESAPHSDANQEKMAELTTKIKLAEEALS